ncbi:MAG: MerR family transcriptional regulator [Bacteroidota bacterium]|nr:MerR family transcriptional regulator [Bacteroidota bacterium]
MRKEKNMVCKFSIKDLEKLSGIKAHTLRIWEQRYGILTPERTDTNIRWYCNDALKHILNVSLLNNNGYKISRIAALTKEEIVEEVNKIVACRTPECEQIDNLVISMVEMDEIRFEKIINNAILRKGFSYAIEEVIYPFLSKIGVMWQTGSINPAQEHFISNLIRQKLIAAIDGQVPSENKKSKRCLLYLPEGEMHELSLLYFNYLLKTKGHRVIYLGQSVPIIDVQRVYEIRKPHYIISVITHMLDEPEAYLKSLSKACPDSTIMLSGAQICEKKVKTSPNLHVFSHPKELLSGIL